MRDTENTEIEYEGGTFERVAEGLLVDGNIVDEDVAHCRADLVPLGAIACQAPKNDWLTLGKFDIVVIRVLSAHRHYMWGHYRCRVHTRSNGVGDDFRSSLGGNLKEVVTKIFDQGVRLGCVDGFEEPPRHIGVAAGRLRGGAVNHASAKNHDEK